MAESKLTEAELKQVEKRIIDEIISSAAEETVAKAEMEALEATKELKVVKHIPSDTAKEPEKAASIEVKTESKKAERKQHVVVLTPNSDKK